MVGTSSGWVTSYVALLWVQDMDTELYRLMDTSNFKSSVYWYIMDAEKIKFYVCEFMFFLYYNMNLQNASTYTSITS